ncbi:hypothetical protein C8R48DRAFT_674189 [Suillus tomentosus]|nr:hypothetical protein C8R48DRAFT_674189 [Suillus tomentosus]
MEKDNAVMILSFMEKDNAVASHVTLYETGEKNNSLYKVTYNVLYNKYHLYHIMAQVNGDANANDLVNSGGDEANINENENEMRMGIICCTLAKNILRAGANILAGGSSWVCGNGICYGRAEQSRACATTAACTLPPNPPIRMSRRDRCLVELMVEEKRDLLIQLWQELDEVERVLGVEVVEDV